MVAIFAAGNFNNCNRTCLLAVSDPFELFLGGISEGLFRYVRGGVRRLTGRITATRYSPTTKVEKIPTPAPYVRGGALRYLLKSAGL